MKHFNSIIFQAFIVNFCLFLNVFLLIGCEQENNGSNGDTFFITAPNDDSSNNEDIFFQNDSSCLNYQNDINVLIDDTNANRDDYPISNIFDNDPDTFFTTETLQLNDSLYVIFDLEKSRCINYVEFWDNYTNQWSMGDLTIYLSNDGTLYKELTSFSHSDVKEENGHGSIEIMAFARYIKVEMNYNGEGAYGGSPSFYMSEVKIVGE